MRARLSEPGMVGSESVTGISYSPVIAMLLSSRACLPVVLRAYNGKDAFSHQGIRY